MDSLWGVSDCHKGKVITGSFACSQYSLDLVKCDSALPLD